MFEKMDLKNYTFIVPSGSEGHGPTQTRAESPNHRTVPTVVEH